MQAGSKQVNIEPIASNISVIEWAVSFPTSNAPSNKTKPLLRSREALSK